VAPARRARVGAAPPAPQWRPGTRRRGGRWGARHAHDKEALRFASRVAWWETAGVAAPAAGPAGVRAESQLQPPRRSRLGASCSARRAIGSAQIPSRWQPAQVSSMPAEATPVHLVPRQPIGRRSRGRSLAPKWRASSSRATASSSAGSRMAPEPAGGCRLLYAVKAAQAFSTFPSRLCCGSRITSSVSRSIFRTPANPNGV
jgi:hypothetical protein